MYGSRDGTGKDAFSFIQSPYIKAIAAGVKSELFAMLEIKFDFKLSSDSGTEEK